MVGDTEEGAEGADRDLGSVRSWDQGREEEEDGWQRADFSGADTLTAASFKLNKHEARESAIHTL